MSLGFEVYGFSQYRKGLELGLEFRVYRVDFRVQTLGLEYINLIIYKLSIFFYKISSKLTAMHVHRDAPQSYPI